MTGYVPAVGDYVRITSVREGRVTRADAGVKLGALYFGVRDSHGDFYGYTDAPGLTIERLPEPEPEWQRGDVVTDARGGCYARIWEASPNECAPPTVWLHLDAPDEVSPWCIDDQLARPLTPLVRGGKLWAEATGGAQ